MNVIPVGIYIEAPGLYEATVAVEYHIRELNRQGIRPIIGSSSGANLDSATYQKAIESGLAPARVTQQQKEDFLQRPRVFGLREKGFRKNGILGLGRLYSYEVYATDICASCGGKLYWKHTGCEQADEKICDKCGSPARILEKQPSVEKHRFERVVIKNGPDSCRIKKVCRSCGYEECTEDYGHTYPVDEFGREIVWEYVDAESCEQVRKCLVCGFVESRTEHDGEWVHVPGSNYVSDGVVVSTEHQTCTRCGTLETRSQI
jgi:hypothetical protein